MDHQSAIVTGGSDRIGKAIALHLAELGYHIVLHYNSSAEKAEKTKLEICALGVKCQTIQVDFTSKNVGEQLFGKIDPTFDVKILVNNASDFLPSNFDSDSEELLHHHFKINFVSPYSLTKAFARKKENGLIINLLDTNVDKHKTAHLDYLLSKKLLRDFTHLSAVGLAPNFRVNAIAPGLILPPGDKDINYLLEKAKNIPLQTIGNLKQIRNALRFFVANPFVTGQTIYVDGGERF